MNFDNFKIACNSSKLPYTSMDIFGLNGDIQNTGKKYIVLCDLSYILSKFERFEKIDDEFTDSDLDNNTTTKMAYELLNTLSHYRHYMYKNRHRNVLIIYASNSDHYTRYSSTFNKILRLTNMFKKTIFIERVDNPTRFTYTHLAYFTVMSVFNINRSNLKTKCNLIYVGNNPVQLQCLRIDSDMVNIRTNSITRGLQTFFKSESYANEQNVGDLRNIDLISTIISTFGFKGGFDRLDGVKGKRFNKLLDIIINNNLDFVDKDNPDTVLVGLDLTPADKSLYSLRMKQIDVDYQTSMYNLVKDLMKIWESKVIPKKINDCEDEFTIDDSKLNINWLGEF